MKKTIVALVCLTAILSGCAAEGTPSGGGVTFTDALGRSVTVEREPERVASLLGSFADVWVLAGGDLCAAAEDAWEDFRLELPDAVNLGGAHSPSLELLLSSDPDFVIASASTAGDVEMLDTLEAAKITVAYFDVDNFEDYLEMLKICTDITGREDLYEKNGLEVKAQIESVKARYAELQIPEEQRSVLLIRASESSIKAKGSRGTILGEMLADMGCLNIADSESSILEDLSVEAVIAARPYRVFVVTMGDDAEAAAGVDVMFREDPAWGSLEAAREGRVYIMDKSLFNLKPNDRWGEAYEKLYDALTEE